MDEKKSFFKGAMLGILSAIIIVSVILGGAFYYGIIEAGNNDQKKQASGLAAELSDKMERIEMILDRNYLDEYDQEQLENGIFAGMLASLGDPYTVYYNEEAFKSLLESGEGVYYGIGVVVHEDLETGEIIVNYPYANGPGAEAGILSGDIIYSVSGELASLHTLDEVVAMIRGEEGTWVDVEVLREGSMEPIALKVQRRKIEVETVKKEMLPGNIGYVQVSQFEDVTPGQYEAALDQLVSQGMESLIIDLRSNPGGSLSAVMEMMDLMLPKGLYTYLEDKNGRREDYKGTRNAKYDYPAVILVNGYSASASELFTGAMKDYKKATIVGTTTFGKGIVQQIYPLNDGTGIKVTMAKYYTPNGICIHKTGIQPDVVVELDPGEHDQTVGHDEDNQLQKAIEILSK